MKTMCRGECSVVNPDPKALHNSLTFYNQTLIEKFSADFD